MNKTKLVALFVAVVGTSLYIYSYLNQPETWESYNEKGLYAFQGAHYVAAEKYFVQALELAETFPLNDRRRYFSLYQLAEVYRIRSKFIEAEPLLKRILEIDKKELGPEHTNVALGLNNLASNYRMRGKYEEAENLLKQALQILERSLGEGNGVVGNILEHYAHLLHKMGRFAEAEQMEIRYQEIYSRQEVKN